ncbi:MAG: copper chaperone PCu(A)C [Pseudonocardiaceae bacterium]
MSRRHKSMRSPLALAAQLVACFAAVLALAGCGAGQVTQTDSQVAAIDGASANQGGIALRDVLIPYPATRNGAYPTGSNARLQLTIINQGTIPDTLVSATTSVARQVLLEGTTTIPPQTSVTSAREAGAGPTATPTAPASPLDAGLVRVQLVGITRPLRAGPNIEITFVFQHAGAITVAVPIGPPTNSVRTPLQSNVSP